MSNNVLRQETATNPATLLCQVTLAVLGTLGCLSCSSPDAPDVPLAAESASSVHVAFAGGGWRAHTAHAAWTISLLEDGTKTLDEVFANVATISSNSGGTWFNSMLVYSTSFAASLEIQGALQIYPTMAGYLGQQKALLEKADAAKVWIDWCAPFETSFPYIYFYCKLATIAGGDGVVWSDIVSEVVFEPFGMGVELKRTLLNGQRQDWAAGKSLLMAATMLTGHAVLNENDWLDKRYYDATVDTGPSQVNLTPLTFSSTPGMQAPPFLAAGGFDLEYTENADIDPSSASAKIANPLPSDGVRVLAATAASSAALGAAASYPVLEENGFSFASWQTAYELSDLALPFSLQSPIQNLSPVGLSVDQLAGAKLVRVADGGYLDNSGVAQLVSFLQLNDQATDFQIVAFDNVQKLYEPAGGKGAAVGIDLATLFGEGLGGPNHDQLCADGFCVNVPSQQVFAAEPLEETSAVWQNAPESGMLIYTRYEVTTVDNETLGVKAGSSGTLHAFTCAWPTAATAPLDGLSDFAAYEAMLNGIYEGLTANGDQGLSYLRTALAGDSASSVAR